MLVVTGSFGKSPKSRGMFTDAFSDVVPSNALRHCTRQSSSSTDPDDQGKGPPCLGKFKSSVPLNAYSDTLLRSTG